jgi:hypothetical protein
MFLTKALFRQNYATAIVIAPIEMESEHLASHGLVESGQPRRTRRTVPPLATTDFSSDTPHEQG